jgi:hypothetical protein
MCVDMGYVLDSVYEYLMRSVVGLVSSPAFHFHPIINHLI